jgi:glycosyltransferase involved in cell wall biosynthesis
LQSLGVHPRRIKTIGNPIRSFKKLDRQTARLALNLKDDRFTILWLGRMCEEKAPQLLVEAAPYLRQSGLDPLFLYAGIPYENIHEAFYPLAEKLGAKVMFLGYLADPSPAYFASDVYCLTSKFENFPIVLFEALATGLPSVSPQLPIVENELNNHYGLYTYHREEIETLSDAILKVHDEPIIDKAKISIDTLEKFGYDRTAQQHIDLYQYLLNS